MAADDNELAGYYVLKAQNLITLTKNTNANYYKTADLLQESVISTEIDLWEKNEVYRLMNYFIALRNVMSLLDEMINAPSKESLQLAKKHKIDGLLIKEEVLVKLNLYLVAVETFEAELNMEQKSNIVSH